MVSYNRRTQPGTMVHVRPHTNRRTHGHTHTHARSSVALRRDHAHATRGHTCAHRTPAHLHTHRTHAHTHMARPMAVRGEFRYNKTELICFGYTLEIANLKLLTKPSRSNITNEFPFKCNKTKYGTGVKTKRFFSLRTLVWPLVKLSDILKPRMTGPRRCITA